MPLILQDLVAISDAARVVKARLRRDLAVTVWHETWAELAQTVAKDPRAIAVTGRSVALPAKVLALTDRCGFPLLPTLLAVKSSDYPLTLPMFFPTSWHRLPLVAREFFSTPDA